MESVKSDSDEVKGKSLEMRSIWNRSRGSRVNNKDQR